MPGHSKDEGVTAGSNVKNMLDRAVWTGDDILCAKDVLRVIQEKQSIILGWIVDQEDIEVSDGFLPPDLILVKKYEISVTQKKMCFNFVIYCISPVPIINLVFITIWKTASLHTQEVFQ